MGLNPLVLKCRKELIEIYKHSIDSIRPDKIMKRCLRFEHDKLVVDDIGLGEQTEILDLTNRNIHVIGAGKSTLKMALGLADMASKANLCNRFTCGSLSLPVGLKPEFEKDRDAKRLLDSLDICYLFGSENNLPDQGSTKASEHILNTITEACKRDAAMGAWPLFIVLISGGGSACLASPRWISLEEKRDLIKFLTQKGANIVELNIVRRYFSNIKGGQLARHIASSHPAAHTLCLLLSDVIGDPIEYIASGPTYISREELSHDYRKAMVSILRKFNYPKLDQLLAKCPKEGSPKMMMMNGDCHFERISNHIVGNNTIAVQAASNLAKELGYTVVQLGNDLQGSSDQVVDRMNNVIKQASTSTTQKLLVLGGGEVTIKKLEGEYWGLGGRAQEMALDYMMSRMQELPTHGGENEFIDMFLAGGTDGQDGPTDVAACLVSYEEWKTSTDPDKFTLKDIKLAKQNHNSNTFWNKFAPNWLIKTGMTGTNVMDIYMCSVYAREKQSKL